MSKSPITTDATKLPPIHPGRILLEDLRAESIGINALAQAIRVPASRISLIVNRRRGITADTEARYLDCIDAAAIARDVIPRAAA